MLMEPLTTVVQSTEELHQSSDKLKDMELPMELTIIKNFITI
jgi:hypothetical protein